MPGKLGQNEEKNVGDDAKNFFRDMIMKNQRRPVIYFIHYRNACVCVEGIESGSKRERRFISGL